MENKFLIESQYNIKIEGLSVTIKIDGELNAKTVILFEQEVKNIFLKQPQDVYLDLDKVTLLVSVGIGSLLLIHDFVTQKDYKFQIVRINDKVRNILHVMGLDYIMAM